MKRTKQDASLLIDSGNILGESPVWHPYEHVLYWVDIIPGIVNRWDPSTGIITKLEMGCMTGCVAPFGSDGIYIACTDGLFCYAYKQNKIRKLADFPEQQFPENRFNDGKVDVFGRFWVGTMNKNVLPEAGSLYCFSNNKFQKMISGITLSNGMCWSKNQKYFYYIDSMTRQVKVYSFDFHKGIRNTGQTIIRIPEKYGLPDGMTIDADGNLLIALWGGSCISRWNTNTGNLIDKIYVPAPHVTSCDIGGPDKRTLFITTARDGLTPKQLKQYPLSGGVFTYQL